ncbi:MAG: hypothetical protein MRJ96_16770 [Nitrospirales bacterium]|nr:hypothetical protein [Nitrospira sp.]MDR4503098.1 hypothetical protein [Nitrospirales bacterium]
MKRRFTHGIQEDGMTTEEWWASKHQKQRGSVFIRSGKPSKVQSPGLLRCAECGSEVKVLVSPRRNPHSSKLGRAVSMKDHDLCRRCWRRLMQHDRQVTVVDLRYARRSFEDMEQSDHPPTAC